MSDAEWWECLLLAVQDSCASPETVHGFAEALDSVLAARRWEVGDL